MLMPNLNKQSLILNNLLTSSNLSPMRKPLQALQVEACNLPSISCEEVYAVLNSYDHNKKSHTVGD